MDTRGLIFYHGTTADSARQIITGGARDLCSHLNMQLAAKIIVARIEMARGGYIQAFCDSDCKLWDIAPSALNNMATGNTQSLAAYGPFFATLDPRSAYQYALRGGSEALQCLRVGVEVTEWLGRSVRSELQADCPELLREIDNPSISQPVVIGLGGVSSSRLTSEAGEALTSGWWEFMTKRVAERGRSVPATVRIADVVSSDVVAVHELGGHAAIDESTPPYFPEGWSLPEASAPSRWLDEQIV